MNKTVHEDISIDNIIAAVKNYQDCINEVYHDTSNDNIISCKNHEYNNNDRLYNEGKKHKQHTFLLSSKSFDTLYVHCISKIYSHYILSKTLPRINLVVSEAMVEQLLNDLLVLSHKSEDNSPGNDMNHNLLERRSNRVGENDRFPHPTNDSLKRSLHLDNPVISKER